MSENYLQNDKRPKLNNESNLNRNLRRSDRNKNKLPISYDETDDMYEHVIYRAESLASDIPNTFQEIQFRPDRVMWKEAIQNELNLLAANDTWTLVERPRDKNIVECK